jgi:hypothetical protein
VPPLRHDRFSANPFQFVSRYSETLHLVGTDSGVMCLFHPQCVLRRCYCLLFIWHSDVSSVWTRKHLIARKLETSVLLPGEGFACVTLPLHTEALNNNSYARVGDISRSCMHVWQYTRIWTLEHLYFRMNKKHLFVMDILYDIVEISR